jgi:hypothetical protein
VHDFGAIVYLDLQKTGSSFVSEFLKHSCTSPERKFLKHAWIGNDFRQDASYFITVRHPETMYSSLYRYGLESKGEVFHYLKSNNLLAVYSSFDKFVWFLLNLKTPKILHPGYNRRVSSQIGFMSFRYLLLTVLNPPLRFREALDAGVPLTTLAEISIARYVLKNESLNAELLKLSTQLLPEYFDAVRAREFLDRAPRINQSSRPSNDVRLQSRELRTILESKESILMKYYS